MEMQKGVQDILQKLSESKLKISKEEAYKYISQVEEKKMQAQIKMQMAVASNAFPKEAIEQLMEFEKQKAFDELFNEYGVEEHQLRSFTSQTLKLKRTQQSVRTPELKRNTKKYRSLRAQAPGLTEDENEKNKKNSHTHQTIS